MDAPSLRLKHSRVGLLVVAVVLLSSAFVPGVSRPTAGTIDRQPPPFTQPAAGARVEGGPAPNSSVPVLIAVGDIASCGSNGDEATAALLDDLDGTVATLGDHVYGSGTAAQFANCYDPSWGRHKERTRPAPGNHDLETEEGAGYFGYFGTAAAQPGEGWYSYDVGAWHVVALNSNCGRVGGCEAGSGQEEWLRADLATHGNRCTLAYWHHPRFSSGEEHGSEDAMRPFWQALYDAGADVVLSGHEHNYERFAPQDPAGEPDARGIRQFVVGTGGKSHYGFGKTLPNSEVRNGDAFGVLRLTLHAEGYDWTFVPVASESFSDAGSGTCH